MTTSKGVQATLVGKSLIYSFTLLVKSLKRISNNLTIVWIVLEGGHSKNNKKLL